MSIYLKNATFIDSVSLEFTQTNIKVNQGIDGKIELLKDLPELKHDDQLIDCTGKYVTHSFVCGHHHVYSALARGMNAPKKNPVNFYEILKYIWWTLDKSLDKDMIEASALVTAIAAAKSGVSFVVDHHASPNFIQGSLEIIANAFNKVGVSHLLCYEITDRDGLNKAQEGLDETETYLQKHQGLVGLHASFTVGDATLKSAIKLAEKYDSGIHIHVAEDMYDQSHCKKEYKMRVIERLYWAGGLNSSKSILGHCLHLSPEEKILIKNHEVWVVQNTESNLNNNVGYFSSQDLSNRIMLGTDGMHSDMLRSAKVAYFVGQNFDNINFVSAYERFRNAHKYINENGFVGDGENNLVVLDYDSPTLFNSNNFLGHFLFGIESRHVQHVISSGKLIVKDRNITTVNEAEILAFAKEQSVKLWEKMSEI